jgi:hypothetical protein
MWGAHSPIIAPSEPIGFPYSNIKAVLGVGYDGVDEWVYIQFSQSPNLLNTTIRDGYDIILYLQELNGTMK